MAFALGASAKVWTPMEEEQAVARGEVSLDGSHAELQPDVLRKEEVVVS